MGYSNSFKLKVEGKISKKVKASETCDCGVISEDLDSKFCSKCGSPLIEKTMEIDASHVIKEFVKTYEEGDAGYLLDEKGNSEESGSGYKIRDEIIEFSQKYPDLTFILSCHYDGGLVSEGEPGTDYFFISNGVEKRAEAKITYTNPFTGEIFNFK
jgi:hypothetical protein